MQTLKKRCGLLHCRQSRREPGPGPTGNSWARRCIKAVAGLYILVVLLQVIPQSADKFSPFLCQIFARIDGHAGRCHSG